MSKKNETRKVTVNGVEFNWDIDQLAKFINELSTTKDKDKDTKKNKKTSTPEKVVEKAPVKADEEVIGKLIFSGLYMKTGAEFMHKNQRYAIRCAAENVGAEKLKEGDPVYDMAKKQDKFVQVYKFPDKKTIEAFKKSQREYLK